MSKLVLELSEFVSELVEFFVLLSNNVLVVLDGS